MSGIQQGLIASYKATPTNTYATWNPSDKNANITLSNGNLTATCTNDADHRAFRATIGKSSGKWYWEVTPVTTPNSIIGIGTSSATLNSYLGADINGWGYYTSIGTSNKPHNGSLPSYGAAFSVGDVIGVALDMDGGTITFYKNNVSQGQAFTGVSGTIYPMGSIGHTNEAQTANFGATTMAYTAPSGYNQGIYN